MTEAQVNLADSINNYKELMFWLRNTSGRVYTSIIIPVLAFKTFIANGRSIGLEINLDRRIYVSIWYNSDTTISAVSSETTNTFYWQILGIK